MKNQMILPGARIGIIGGGQLGRMMAFAAKRMGYFVTVLDPDPMSSCAQVVDQKIVAQYDDHAALKKLAQSCDVVTYEFENIDLKAIEALEKKKHVVRPSSVLLKLKQNRIFEKTTLVQMGIAVAAFAKIEKSADLEDASQTVGFPAILKTAYGGYDGKGQALVVNLQEAVQVFEKFDQQVLIWEKRIPFIKEFSIVAARNPAGEFAVYPVSQTVHVENILNTTITPDDMDLRVQKKVVAVARKIAAHFDYVGIFCIEFFLLENGQFLVNEIAPRPHNSGHYTIEACATSQFEQHIRAICGLSLGSVQLRSPAVMVNILGNKEGQPLSGIANLLAVPGLSLHLYGKKKILPKRKIGHFTVLGDTVDATVKNAKKAIAVIHSSDLTA